MSVIQIPQWKREEKCQSGETLLQVLHRARVPLAQSCGGRGICGTCALSVEGEGVPDKTQLEEQTLERHRIAKGLRLACLLKCPEQEIFWILKTRYW